MERYGTLLFLLFSSFLDIRKREISIPVTLLFGLAGVVYSVRTGRTMTDYLIPLGIGILILGGSVLTRGQVGMGDGWMLLALGCMLRMECYIQMAWVILYIHRRCIRMCDPCNPDRNLMLYPECTAHGFCHTFAFAVTVMYVKCIHMPKRSLINQAVDFRCPINVT